MKRTRLNCFLVLVGILLMCPPDVLSESEARVWQEDLVIPTWKLGPVEANPTFSWSSPRQEVYPYPYKEILTDKKTDITYKACWLENEFIKVLVLPEIGGRLHGAVDKTNNYNFFYWQPTIKPALVGMTGAWISGGIEWNFPHGHRPTGLSPVQYRLVENADGSKTVWVGEPELVQRMRWIVGLTIYPGKSVIEAKVRLFNSSPLRHSFQMWTTTAVNANEDYQVVFPTRLMTGHGKFEYFHWPINEGVDISWWKNVPNAASYFAEEPGGYFGGYDHSRQAGTVITGDPGIVNGKKFWTWGTSPSGRIWEPILTEGEGPYIEPQAGAYSDNQPDYHWLEPGEIKVYSHYFFPVRDIGPFDMANVNGALSLTPGDETVRFGVYSTQVLSGASIVLTRGSEVLLKRTVDLDPGTPHVGEVALPGAVAVKEELRLQLVAGDGEELIGYSPKSLGPVELPIPRKPFDEPAEIKTQDELWHAGDWTYKFRDAEKGRRYFEEALRRDPGDSRSRASLAELDIKRGRYESALEHLSVAEARDFDNGSIFYLKALALELMGRYDRAYDVYYRTAHFEDFLSRAYERLAMLELRKQNFEGARDFSSKAIQKNMSNPRLWVLKAVSLRYLGAYEEAKSVCQKALELDPLDGWAANELALILKRAGQTRSSEVGHTRELLHNSQTAIEVALYYSNAGLYQDAADLLQLVETDSLVNYYVGYFKSQSGDPEAAREFFGKGRRQSIDYQFAFRHEGLDVFRTALDFDSKDGTAHYYLGLVYAKLRDIDKAIDHWKEAVKLDSENHRAWRNLGLALSETRKEYGEALRCYEKAFKVAPDDSRVLLEMDRIKEELGESSEQRLALLLENLTTVKSRDALVASLVDLLLEKGSYEEALRYLEGNHFNSWEGNYSIHNAFMEANIGLAQRAADPKESLRYYLAACEYPANLEVAPREPNLRGFLYLPMARLYRGLGETEKARDLLEISASEESQFPTLATYYRALALKDLGNDVEAERALRELTVEAEALLKGASENHSRMRREIQRALGNLYLAKISEAAGDQQKASQYMNEALSGSPRIEREAITIAQRTYARAHQ